MAGRLLFSFFRLERFRISLGILSNCQFHLGMIENSTKNRHTSLDYVFHCSILGFETRVSTLHSKFPEMTRQLLRMPPIFHLMVILYVN